MSLTFDHSYVQEYNFLAAMNPIIRNGEEASSSFTPEELAYYGSSTIAYNNSMPVTINQNSSPAPEKSERRVPHRSRTQAPRQKTPHSKAMSYQGNDLVAEAGELSNTVSWHEAHPKFVIVLVGPEEIPFGLQQNLLCAQSPFYRDLFENNATERQIESIVKLPDTTVDVFGCFQNFVYTGKVYDEVHGKEIPDYPLLMGLWKLATKLRMAPLRVAILETMTERRQLTSCNPGTPLLIQAWQDTQEGSGLRNMLIKWSAEHMRASPEARKAFASSLPHEILSELVIVMSELPAPAYTPQGPGKKPLVQSDQPAEIDPDPPRPPKRSRKTDVGPSTAAAATGPNDLHEAKPVVKKQSRRSEPIRGKGKAAVEVLSLSPEEDLECCRALITRMVFGPGYWTRLVKAFRHPVDPVLENVPNYLEVIKKPMDLTTIKGKMDRDEYTTAGEFESDIRQIFSNCYEFWKEGDPVYIQGQKLENKFNTQWNLRHKYLNDVKAEAVE
ncbi:uncharacterized protein L3040_001732 [Drepanopeziza brunnea f. sp. 'multigermtubi']|uniref:Ankyrin repeat-containing protein n=1 Tax=Marssonina brunnea f. sp. multigermtubi (strain MB_m1) TaxID=1072389 RepID=K1WD85_MARBU|nr:ankyrin repeat-containing protein [Drepanopeziza brunnea f. sp. 'multigermtubi' MB_m1]EKD15365.1 ankyrin repeat-containing protein [Drepanopeziza brunnea f. sp. 'multigermtubi' MB_m1]KAJ5051971.1 hypothetical protein L3040_001732 [Drepanopeziza brunnea f. sp. 'multigermtubi']